jgi:O-antigen ligase
MKLARALSELEKVKVQKLILFTGSITTLAIWTKLEDPVNLPKLFVLAIGSMAVLGFIFPAIINFRSHNSIQRQYIFLILCFLIGLFVSTLKTDVWYTAFFGEAGRNNGALQYACLSVLSVSVVMVFRSDSISRYIRSYAITGVALSLYGVLQGLKLDPVNWQIVYNPFITTLGNPNFTSSFTGTAGVAIVATLFIKSSNRSRILLFIGLCVDLIILYKSGSIQGVIGFAIGVTIIIVTRIWLFRRSYGQAFLFAVALLAVPVAAAIFNLGPLASRLYQGTLRNRLDYWQAAINMFESNKVFGIGVDRFGAYYQQFSIQDQLVKEQLTDNAHNIYLQILATGGLVTFVPYLLLFSFITFAGLRFLISANVETKIQSASVFAIWISLCAIGLVGIDNIGISVWMWISGGAVIANTIVRSELPQDKNNKDKKSKVQKDDMSAIYPQVLAFTLALFMLLNLAPVLMRSNNLYLLTISSPNSDKTIVSSKLNSLLSSSLNDPQTLIKLSILALSRGFTDIGEKAIDLNLALDNRSFYAYSFKAQIFEYRNDLTSANANRIKLLEIAPWNTSNMLQLATNYLKLGEKGKALNLASRINEIYPSGPDDLQAQKLFAEG